MTIVSVPIFLDDNAIESLTVSAEELTEHLAAHPWTTDHGQGLDPARWAVTHIRTGLEIGRFENWDPLQSPVSIHALRQFAQWFGRHIDLNTFNTAELTTRITSHAGIDFLDVISFYENHINDWIEPPACTFCGAVNAHPAAHKCWECRTKGHTHQHNAALTAADLYAALTEPEPAETAERGFTAAATELRGLVFGAAHEVDDLIEHERPTAYQPPAATAHVLRPASIYPSAPTRER